ncbi:MAG TPA: hypothetical protein VKE92_15780, partial [Anaerolineales bacterium]|nr:hypothetical protein [Anaerolineales bacterium]
TQNFMRGEAGARLFWEMKGDKSCFSPYLGLSWVGDFPLEDSKFQATFIDQTPVMDVTSYTKSQQMVSPQAGLQYTHCCGVRGIVSYKGFYNRDIEINDFEARIDWRF